MKNDPVLYCNASDIHSTRTTTFLQVSNTSLNMKLIHTWKWRGEGEMLESIHAKQGDNSGIPV
jgi:hypothetical protein